MSSEGLWGSSGRKDHPLGERTVLRVGGSTSCLEDIAPYSWGTLSPPSILGPLGGASRLIVDLVSFRVFCRAPVFQWQCLGFVALVQSKRRVVW